MNGPNRLVCIACSRAIGQEEVLSRCVIHSCCSRPVCDACLTERPRLATFCVLCEGVQDAFRKGPRNDVTRAGQVVFDFERACDDMHQLGGGGGGGDENVVRKSPPPAYSEATEQHDADAFTIGDADDTATEEDAALQSMATEPALLRPDRLTSKRGRGDVTVNDATQVNASASHRPDRSDDDRATASLRQALNSVEGTPRESKIPSTASSKPQRGTSDTKDVDDEGLTRQYWLRPNDTLMSLSLRFRITASHLCKLNDLPPSTLTSTPHLIHTRRFLLIPDRAVRHVLAASSEQASQLEAALQGPAPMSRSRKVERARRQAQSRFRALVCRQNGGVASSEITPCDDRAARAYVALMEDELRSIDFGDSVKEDEQAIDDKKTAETDERADEDEALIDAARERRFDAIVKQAVCRWEMDSDWERAQRAQGIEPDVKQIERSREPHKSTFSSAVSSWLRPGSSKPSEKTRTAEKALLQDA